MIATDLLQTALADIEHARECLHRYAMDTDNPAHGAVEAADHLDAAHAALGGEIAPKSTAEIPQLLGSRTGAGGASISSPCEVEVAA